MTPPIQHKAVMQYITPDEIAEELRVNVDVIYTWLRKGTLRGLKVGKYWRVRPVDYQSFLESQTNVPPENDSLFTLVQTVSTYTKRGFFAPFTR